MTPFTVLLHSLGITLWMTPRVPWSSGGREISQRRLSTGVHLHTGMPSTIAAHLPTAGDLQERPLSTTTHTLTTTTGTLPLGTTPGVHLSPELWMSLWRPLACRNAHRTHDACSERQTTWN